MSWLEVRINSPREGVDALEQLLLDNGAVSVTLVDAADQPLFEPSPGETPLWHQLVLTGLFPQGTDPYTLRCALAAAWAPTPLPPLRFSELPDQAWERAWLDEFNPLRFGNRLWVCPSWWHADAGTTADWQPPTADADAWEQRNADLLRAMEAPGSAVLRLDPGLAFGTGTHPTTALCLRWLDQHPPRGQTLLDFGCGSGILGLAALLLNAACVHGVDNDPQALLATAENCRKNHVAPQCFPTYLPGDWQTACTSGKVALMDGILANILAGTLNELAADICIRLKPGGWLLLSGILVEQAESVITAYTPWCEDFTVADEADWVRISATRRMINA